MKSRFPSRLAPWLALGFALALQAGAPVRAATPAATGAAPGTQPGQTSTEAPGAAASAKPGGKQGKSQEKGGKPAEQPDTVILSDTLHYDDKDKTSVFTGNVVMTRGQMTLRADKLTAHQDPDGNQFGTATMDAPGKLVYVREDNPEKFEVIEARGLQAKYNGKSSEIEMDGQAVVTRFICGKAFDKISGQRVLYNQKTDIYEAFSGPKSPTRDGRVRSIAQPQAKTDAAVAECQKKSGAAPAARKTSNHGKSHDDSRHGKPAKS